MKFSFKEAHLLPTNAKSLVGSVMSNHCQSNFAVNM